MDSEPDRDCRRLDGSEPKRADGRHVVLALRAVMLAAGDSLPAGRGESVMPQAVESMPGGPSTVTGRSMQPHPRFRVGPWGMGINRLSGAPGTNSSRSSAFDQQAGGLWMESATVRGLGKALA